MDRTVELPLWLLLLVLAFAGVTFSSHFLFPSVRWFFRRRAERVVARLNERLPRPIEPFKLARRHDTIERLTYDSEVVAAAALKADRDGTPRSVTLEEARDYAREIVPSFSASLYFGIAIRLARWLARSLYRVRIVNRELSEASPDVPDGSTIVYVINHRSNMDYVLVTYLAAGQTALSYAVGEWARVWPLGRLIRAMGGYFIRRKSRNDLYRKVLSRYVQIATEEGLTQAVFPEGGLSLDGKVAQPKLGILSYIIEGAGDNEVAFVPISLNYDRVLEDRLLTRALKTGKRKFRVGFWAAAGYFRKLITRRFEDRDYRFGHAAVVFGKPLLLSVLRQKNQADVVAAIASDLIEEIRMAVPILPVPLVARAIQDAGGNINRDEIGAAVAKLIDAASDAQVYLPEGGLETAIAEATNGLLLRRVIEEEGRVYKVLESEIIAYYARSISQHIPQAAHDVVDSDQELAT